HAAAVFLLDARERVFDACAERALIIGIFDDRDFGGLVPAGDGGSHRHPIARALSLSAGRACVPLLRKLALRNDSAEESRAQPDAHQSDSRLSRHLTSLGPTARASGGPSRSVA